MRSGFEVAGGIRPLLARRPAGRHAREPRAVTRGDLPAPLRHLGPPVSTATSAVAARVRRRPHPNRLPFATFFALIAFAQAYGYRHSYPTLAERAAFARTFGANRTLQLFYGVPHDLLRSVGGYVAWRRHRLDLRRRLGAPRGGAGAARRGGHRSAGAHPGRDDRAGRHLPGVGWPQSSPAPRCCGSGSSSASSQGGCPPAARPTSRSRRSPPSPSSPASARSQARSQARGGWRSSCRPACSRSHSCCASSPTRRAGSSRCGGRRRSAGPRSCGVRGPAARRPSAAAATVLLVAAAGLVAVRRDVGRGLLERDDTRRRRPAARVARGARAPRPARHDRRVARGHRRLRARLRRPLGELHEGEHPGRAARAARAARDLDRDAGRRARPLLSGVRARDRPLRLWAARRDPPRPAARDAARPSLSAAAAGWPSGCSSLPAAQPCWRSRQASSWAGASSQGVGVSLPRMLEASNCLPASFLFLGLGTLAFALVPRASAGVAYALVSVAFVWQLVGDVVGAPRWLLDLCALPARRPRACTAVPDRLGRSNARARGRDPRRRRGVQAPRPDGRVARRARLSR